MRTLNDITPPSRRREVEPMSGPLASENGPLRLNERPSRFPFTTLTIVAGIVLLSVGALFYFSTAKIEVTPTNVSAAVQGSFMAERNAGNLPYEIITAQKIATQSVEGSGTKAVSSFASGTITIYNAQTKVQRLITNTRFASPTGLIFRIRTPITIPGGSVAKPGSITAMVYADQPGSSYNIGPASFTIPGFAGTPQATQVYARSTESMTGGASGVVPFVDAVLETQTRDALIKALTPDLLASVKEQIPSGYVLLEGSMNTAFDDLPPIPSSATGQVDIKEQGTMTAVIFPNTALAKAIAASVTSLGYQGEPISLFSPDGLLLATSNWPNPEDVSFSFSLSGTASLVYVVDPIRIVAAVAGKTRSAAEVALTNYPEIKRAVIILRPFWRKSFPEDPASISVTIVEP